MHAGRGVGAARNPCRAHYDMALATRRSETRSSANPLRHVFVWDGCIPRWNLIPARAGGYMKWAKLTSPTEEAENQAQKSCLRTVLDGRRPGLTPTRYDGGEGSVGNGGVTKADDTTSRKAVVEGLSSLPSFGKARKGLRGRHRRRGRVTRPRLALHRPPRDPSQGGKEAERRPGSGSLRAGAPDVGYRRHRAGRAATS